MSDRHCEHCRFAHDAGFEWLFCHRFPPTYAPRDPRLRPCLEREWPSVHKHDWCGEFQETPKVLAEPVQGSPEAAAPLHHTFGTPNTDLMQCPMCLTTWFGHPESLCPRGCGCMGRER
jgi:hypothetical protein